MSNIEQLQGKVSGVKAQMQYNLDAAMRRGDELENLQAQAEHIDVEAKHFQKTTTRVKRKEQFKHCKLWLILIGVISIIVFFIVLIIVIIAVVLSNNN